MYWPANHPLSQSVDWIAKGAAQRSWTEGAVQPARRSAPEHDPYMTSEHSTTARWIRLGVDFEEGGNRSARGKPSKSGWDRLKLSPHTTFVVEVEGVMSTTPAWLPKQYSTGCFIPMVTHPDINPVQQGLTSVNRREPVFPFGDNRTVPGTCYGIDKTKT